MKNDINLKKFKFLIYSDKNSLIKKNNFPKYKLVIYYPLNVF